MAHSLAVGVVPAEEGTLAGHAESVASAVGGCLNVCGFGLQGRVNLIHVQQHRTGLPVDGRGWRCAGSTGDRLDKAGPPRAGRAGKACRAKSRGKVLQSMLADLVIMLQCIHKSYELQGR